MSNYPVWWDTSITLYNKYEDAETHIITWVRTNLDNCFWKATSDKLTVGETVIESSVTICRVPKNPNFLPKFEWVKIPNDEMPNYFTFGVEDIIVKGTVEDDINEYVKGQRSTDLIAKYKELQGCIQIQELSVNVGPGRCCEHYYIKGI